MVTFLPLTILPSWLHIWASLAAGALFGFSLSLLKILYCSWRVVRRRLKQYELPQYRPYHRPDGWNQNPAGGRPYWGRR